MFLLLEHGAAGVAKAGSVPPQTGGDRADVGAVVFMTASSKNVAPAFGAPMVPSAIRKRRSAVCDFSHTAPGHAGGFAEAINRLATML
jgi:hypothetical protein